MRILIDLVYCLTLVPHYLYHRLVTRKYGPDAWEKLGGVPARSGGKKCLWVHAVSVGETMAARTIIEAFEQAHPDWEIRLSTTTATGREVARKRFGEDRVFYCPLDLSWMVKRVFRRIRPDLVVLMELEVWPNFLVVAEEWSVPVVVANCRITEKSLRGFERLGNLARKMLNRVRLWLAQSEEYASRLRSLGIPAERVAVVGSVKYDTVPTELDEGIRAEYRALFGVDGAPLLVAGSTHPGEETAVLRACKALWEGDFPDLRVVLVPRHPERLDAVEREAAGFAAVRRRSGLSAKTPADAPVVLLDTMGELAKVYAAADLVFVGGSLIEHGGQNIMEPCGLARPTVMGPSCYNFDEAVETLRGCDGYRPVEADDALAAAFAELLRAPETAAAMGRRARKALLGRQGATTRTIELLDGILRDGD